MVVLRFGENRLSALSARAKKKKNCERQAEAANRPGRFNQVSPLRLSHSHSALASVVSVHVLPRLAGLSVRWKKKQQLIKQKRLIQKRR